MDRREFLTNALLGAAGTLVPWAPNFNKVFAGWEDYVEAPPNIFAGWIDSPSARRRFLENNPKPLFSQWDHEIRGSGDGRQVLLHKAYEKVTGTLFKPRKQTIGDCVGQGSGLATDTLMAVQIALKNSNEEWKGDSSTEVIYAGSRVEIAGEPGRSDGSNGVDAANWLNKYGVVLRGKYGDIDITTYRPDLARKWTASRDGVPSELEALAKGHPINTIARIDSFDQLADAIANGYPVLICSGQGFNSKRDADGYLRASGSWAHCMCVWGIDTLSDRKGGLIENSWGPDWVSGPEGPLGCPLGGFWADAKVLDRMLRQHDSYALSNYMGYPGQSVPDYHLW